MQLSCSFFFFCNGTFACFFRGKTTDTERNETSAHKVQKVIVVIAVVVVVILLYASAYSVPAHTKQSIPVLLSTLFCYPNHHALVRGNVLGLVQEDATNKRPSALLDSARSHPCR
jgi:hypothetical protein